MNEEVKSFLNLLSNYKRNQILIEELKEKVELLYYKLSGVSSISFERNSSTNIQESELRKYEIREQIEKLKQRIQLLESMNQYIDDVLKYVDDDVAIESIRCIYMNEETYEKVAKKFNYTKSTIFYKIQIELSRALLKAHK